MKSRNFDHKIHFWKIGCFTSLKNAFGRFTKNLTCFSIFIFRSNVARGAKYGTISNFLSYGFAIQGLVLKKIHFSTSSCEKTFKIKLKLLQKCLKKNAKKVKKNFSSKTSLIYRCWSKQMSLVSFVRVFETSFVNFSTIFCSRKSRSKSSIGLYFIQ